MEATCQCGQLTATVPDDAQAMVIACHCRDCQRRSGSPFGVMAYFPADQVSLTGESRHHVRATDTGGQFTNSFCPHCGSTMLGRASRHPSIAGVPIGCLPEPQRFMPHISVYEQSQCSWAQLPPTIPHHPRGRDS